MAHLYDEKTIKSNSPYYDIKVRGNVQRDVVQSSLDASTTLYVGNIPTTAKEEQLHELFSNVGPIERIVLGIDRETREPCGFCFVEYVTRKDAEDCLKYINGMHMREEAKSIYVDWDVGYTEGREFKVKKGDRRFQNRGGSDVQYNIQFDDEKQKYKVEIKESERSKTAPRIYDRGPSREQYPYPSNSYNDQYPYYPPTSHYHYPPQRNYYGPSRSGHLGKRRRSRSYDDDDNDDGRRGKSRSRSKTPEEHYRKRIKADEGVEKRM